jgi:hypothetical protein
MNILPMSTCPPLKSQRVDILFDKPTRPPIVEVQGDLLEMAARGEFDIIAHGCNCFCTVGTGLASSFRNTFPEVMISDKSRV